jgi:serine/threonine protein kinase, bacterial
MRGNSRLRIDVEPFPGYRLVRFLGGGGFGHVWEAQAPGGSRIALKFLPCDDQKSAAREIRALQAIKELRHPHLLKMEGVWCYNRFLVLAMELADGSLDDLLKSYRNQFDTPISPEHTCYLLSQAADALDFLNAREHWINSQIISIQHCDIKPSNLLLFGDTLKIGDFGLASSLSSQVEHRSGSGTMNFCAPEILRGQLSTQTDQYSLAVTYCILRGGRFPFADSADVWKPGYARPTPDLSMLAPAEQPIVGRALNSIPQNRWQSCGEFMSRLANLIYQGTSQPTARDGRLRSSVSRK